jgi:flagellar assembly protein FliH
VSAAPARFTFDLDLGRRSDRQASVPESALAALLVDAREEGFREGRATGAREAADQAAHALAAATEALARSAASMAGDADRARRHALAQAVPLAHSIARKIAGQLIERLPEAELAALIEECLATLDAVPHLVIRCAPELADRVRDIATARMATAGFNGRLVVLGDPDLPPGDGRIEWADGGLNRDTAAIVAEVDLRIAEFLDAAGVPLPTAEAAS